MKKLITFLGSKPSYLKWGAERISLATGIALSTVTKFRKSKEFKALKANYFLSIKHD